jgi:hypothetical protein
MGFCAQLAGSEVIINDNSGSIYLIISLYLYITKRPGSLFTENRAVLVKDKKGQKTIFL